MSHTHWDREWYLPFQQFRILLVEAVDSLLEIMGHNPDYRYFTLDGQTIALEDYLEVRPEREEDLRRLIEAGRILVGPWYVMPDEFLVSGESLLRNLIEGRRTAARFGPVMRVGYIPDPFGHVSQMPQILRGFGIDSAVLWRGVGSELRHNEALWVGPDGSQVLLEHMPGGYDNAGLLPVAPDALMERLAQIRAQLEPRATTSFLLLMNGDDHMFPQPEVPAIVAEANRQLRDAEVIDGTLPMLLQGIREELSSSGIELHKLEGEFRSSEQAHLLAGVLSTRMNLKQRNARCQSLLERWAEPFGSFAALLDTDGETGGRGDGETERRGEGERDGRGEHHRVAASLRLPVSPSPRPPVSPSLLRLAWRYLLMNQPHDSICGCSVDQVHQEMETRYDWCEQVAEQVAGRALESLAQLADTESLLMGEAGRGAVVVFNSESGPRNDFASALMQLPGDREEPTLLDVEGRPVPCQILATHSTELAGVTLGRQEVQGYLRLAGPGRDWPHWKLRLLEKVIRAALRGRMPDLVISNMDVLPGADPSTVDVEVEAAEGREHNYDAVSNGMRQLTNLVDRGNARFFRLRVRRRDQAEIGFVAPAVPPHGLKLFRIGVGPPAQKPGPAVVHPKPVLENEYLSLQPSPEDGSVRLIDRETGAIYWGINSLVDGGDAGDEYSYSPPARDTIVHGPDGPPIITVEERGPARHRMRIDLSLRLPGGLAEDRQSRSAETVLCPVTTWLDLYPGVPRLDVRTTITNRARDHRLRVHFPTHLEGAQCSHADGQFAVVARPIQPTTPGSGWIEHPITSSPQLAFVDVSDGAAGLMIANRGLPEYDVALVEGNPCIALTLLRCVGWLSRDDLTTRQGAAGPLVPTPGAQMLGTHTFEYSVIPHAGGWEKAFQQAYWFARPLRARWTARHSGPLGSQVSFLAVSPATVAVSAIKPPEDGGEGVVVRLCNLLGEPTEVVVRSLFPLASAESVSLAEELDEELPLEDAHTACFPLGPYRITTLRLRPAT